MTALFISIFNCFTATELQKMIAVLDVKGEAQYRGLSFKRAGRFYDEVSISFQGVTIQVTESALLKEVYNRKTVEVEGGTK